MKNYLGSLLFTLVAVSVAFFFLGGVDAAVTVMLLGILETSMSFDNAVVNSGILKNWSEAWQRTFMTWGMLVAVFGMRLVFPLLVVSIAGHFSPLHALHLALSDPRQYAQTLSSTHLQIAAFGGAFLSMVFLKYFIDAEKDKHWLAPIERPLTRLGKFEAIQAAITMVVVLVAGQALHGAQSRSFIEAGVLGLVAYIAADAVKAMFGSEDDLASKVVPATIGGFLYLEMLDASFSFDGVIGAFAISDNMFVIALGLGVGAMFVRSMTVHLVRSGVLNEFRYLEHGAFWAIGAMATILFLGVVTEVPDIITGFIGAAAIASALVSSVIAKKREAAQAAQAVAA